jgi:hypothetical protein
MPDFIGRVENFDAHMKAVLSLAGVASNVTIPRQNEGPPPPFTYDEILDEEIGELGLKLYRSDFKNFGYQL